MLARLIRTPVPGPLLMAIGHCPRRTGSVLLEALDDGSRTGTVVRVELDALDLAAVNQLVSAWSGSTGLDPAYLEQIRAAADGNPRYLRVLTAAGWRPELWPDSPGEDTGALLREGASMAAELDALSPAEISVVGAAAVLGGPFRPEDVAAICTPNPPDASTPPGIDLAGILNALDDLVRADVVRHVAPGARFAFRHPLLGHVAHERASLPTLLAAHQRALDLLKARGAGAVDLARHAEHLVGTDAAAAAPLLARGAGEILPDAPETAVRWLRLALQTPVGERPSAERDALMLECCRALSAAGRFEEALALATTSCATTPGSPARCASAPTRCGSPPSASSAATTRRRPWPAPRSRRCPGRCPPTPPSSPSNTAHCTCTAGPMRWHARSCRRSPRR